MTLQIHNMNAQNLILEQVQLLFNIIQALQAEVADLKISYTLTFSSSQENVIFIAIAKSKKLSDLLMFKNNQKKLHSFVMNTHKTINLGFVFMNSEKKWDYQ